MAIRSEARKAAGRAAVAALHLLHLARELLAQPRRTMAGLPDAWIYHFDAEGVRRVAFEATEHYRVTRAFMMDHRGMESGSFWNRTSNHEIGKFEGTLWLGLAGATISVGLIC